MTLEGELSLGGGWHRFFLSADSTRVRIAYGGLGISLAYDEFPALAETLSDAFADLAPLAENFGIGLPDLSSLSGALENMDGLSGGFDLASFDLGALLSGLTMTEVPGGLFGLSGENITLTVADERFGIASVGLGYTGEGFSLGAGLSLDEFDEWLSMPRITYLGLDDLKDLAEYLTAAAGTVNGNSVKLTLEPVTTSAGQIAAEAELYHGEDFPVRIDTDNQTIVVSADCYLHLNVSVTALKVGDLPLYVEAWVLDGDGDGMLDFYVTASRLREDEAGYEPLVVTSSAQELLPLVASALPLLGIDEDILNDYFIAHWVDGATIGRLSAIGDSLLETLDFFGVFDELFGGAAGGTASDELIAAVVKGEDTFSLTLGGGALGMGSDLVIGLEKTADAEGTPLLKAVSLAFGGTDIAFGLSYDTIEPAVPILPAGQKYELDGMPELFTALANTATHKATEEEIVSGTAESADDILLNRTYLMSGEASLMLGSFGFSVKVDALAVSILENGDIALDARISYNDFFGITASQVDLSIRGSMIYMMRKSGSEVLYRAMPLSVFGATLKDQLVFLLHMSNLLAWMIPDDIGGGMSDEGGDLGAQAANILSSYDFKKAGSEDSVTTDQWLLTLNGEAITGGVLSDIGVTLNEGNGLISSLNVTSSLIDILTLSADLTLENGGESWATEIDYNKTLSDYLANGMDAAIENNKANGWSTYLEGTSATITLEYNGETKTQDVLVNGETVLTKIDFPELEEKEGHILKWVQSGLTFKPEYTPKIYHVQFTTEDALADGFETEYDLAYGTAIEYYVNGELRSTETVGAGDMTLEMPVLDERSVWYKAEASGEVLRLYAYENYDTVIFDDGFGGTSTENFVADYALLTPTKEGYTFLGWWMQKNGSWEKVETLTYSGGSDMTLHALWAEVEIMEPNCSRKGFLGYSYSAAGSVKVQLAGSLKDETYFEGLLDSISFISVKFRVHSGNLGKDKEGTCDESGYFFITRKDIYYSQWTLTATVIFDSSSVLGNMTATGSANGSF